MRDLTALVEQGGQAWAQVMIDLLCDIKRTVETAALPQDKGYLLMGRGSLTMQG